MSQCTKELGTSSDERKFASLQAANSSLDTLEIEGCKNEYLRTARKECREVSKVLLAKHLSEPSADDVLFKAHRNIKRCSLQGAFRNLSDTVNYKIGQALCKNRLCPNCQRVSSAKRKSKFLAWYELNKKPLSKYYFYHMVLTMRHKASENLRTDVYTEELLTNFKKLRGGLGYRDNHAYWNKRVAGGLYSAETTVAHDDTLHIHLHCLVLGKMPLWRKVRRVDAVQTVRNGQKRVYKKKKHKAVSDQSEFEKEVSARWLAITGDSVAGVFIEPVYSLDKDRNKVYYTKGEGVEAAVSECIKYTMKADAESVNKFSPEHLRGLLQLKKRYHGRFGCLTTKSKESAQFVQLDLLNAKTHQLELDAINRQELRHLFNPETGEVVNKEDTRVVVTWFSNTKARESALELRNRYTLPVAEPVTVDVLGESVVTMRTTEVKELLHYDRGETPYGGDTYYELKDLRQVVYFENHEKKEVAMRLAGSMYCRYSKENDLLPPALARRVRRGRGLLRSRPAQKRILKKARPASYMHTFYTITAKQIQLLKNCSYPTARKEWRSIKDALGLDEKQPLMLRQLAAYWGIPCKELAEALYYQPKKLAA